MDPLLHSFALIVREIHKILWNGQNTKKIPQWAVLHTWLVKYI